jgi:hypothetical protein
MRKIGNVYRVLVTERMTILKYILEKWIMRMSTGLKCCDDEIFDFITTASQQLNTYQLLWKYTASGDSEFPIICA